MPPPTKQALQAANRRLADCIEKDPTNRRGEPVFRGTLIPVKSLFDHLAAGDDLNSYFLDFPTVTREQAAAVVEAARLQLLVTGPLEE